MYKSFFSLFPVFFFYNINIFFFKNLFYLLNISKKYTLIFKFKKKTPLNKYNNLFID